MGSLGPPCPHLPSHEFLPQHLCPAAPRPQPCHSLVTSLTADVNPTPAPTLKIEAHPALTLCCISLVLQAWFPPISLIKLAQGIPASGRRLFLLCSSQNTSMVLSCSCLAPRQDDPQCSPGNVPITLVSWQASNCLFALPGGLGPFPSNPVPYSCWDFSFHGMAGCQL